MIVSDGSKLEHVNLVMEFQAIESESVVVIEVMVFGRFQAE